MIIAGKSRLQALLKVQQSAVFFLLTAPLFPPLVSASGIRIQRFRVQGWVGGGGPCPHETES